MRAQSLAVFAIVIALPTLALAQSPDWAASFEHEVTSELVNTPRVIVVSASEDAEDASAALVESLRSRGLELVMTDEALGDTTGLSDEELLEKGRSFPVDGVVIVRVYPSKTAPTAVITHTHQGGAAAASVVAGEAPKVTDKTREGPDAPPDQAQSEPSVEEESAGRSSATSLASLTSSRANTLSEEVASLRRGKYQREKVTYRDEPWTFHLGAFEEELEGEELYRAMGRNDLADSYASDSGAKTALMIGSGAATALGLGLMFVGVIPSFDDQDINWALTGIGIGATTAGIGGLIFGATIDPHPVSDQEARRLVEDHNSILRKKYGVRE